MGPSMVGDWAFSGYFLKMFNLTVRIPHFKRIGQTQTKKGTDT